MGADFCCAILAIPKKDGEPVDCNYDAAIKAVETTDWASTDYYQDGYFDGVEDLKAAALEAIHEVRKVITQNDYFSREAAWVDRPNELLLVSGGMSWGDPPTGLFESLDLLEKTGLAKVLTAQP